MTECRDCPDAKFHTTGSTLWVSCKHVKGWRPIDSKCVLDKESKNIVNGVNL